MIPSKNTLEPRVLPYEYFDPIEWGPRDFDPDKVVAIDVETNGKPWQSGECQIRCVCAVWGNESRVYEWNRSTHRTALRRIMGNRHVPKVMHNAQADLQWLGLAGVGCAGPLQDTISMARCANNLEQKVGLDALGQKYLHMGKVEVKRPWLLPMKELRAYNQRDGEVTWLLLQHSLRRKDVDDWWGTYQKETELVAPVIRMHQVGIPVNYEWCLSFMVQARAELHRLGKGFEGYNPNSYQQLNKLFFNKRGMKPVIGHEKLKDGYYSTSEKWLKRMRGVLIDQVLKHRGLSKVLGYVEGIIEHARWDGKIHSTLLPYTAKTGRWSSKKINVQQIPGEPYICRRAFATESGYELWSLDFDQMEIRIGAAESGEKSLLNAFREGRDIHAETAKRLGITRDHAKVVIYAFMYGAQAETMSDTLRVTVDEAKEILRSFRNNLPRLVGFMNKVKSQIKKKGSLVNPLGRKFRCKEAYQACDYWIQGTGADLLKRSVREVYKLLRGKQSELIMPIHDELVLQIHRDEVELIPQIGAIMEEHEMYCIPLTVTRGLFYEKG